MVKPQYDINSLTIDFISYYDVSQDQYITDNSENCHNEIVISIEKYPTLENDYVER